MATSSQEMVPKKEQEIASSGQDMVQKVQEVSTSGQDMVQKVQEVPTSGQENEEKWYGKDVATNIQEMVLKSTGCGNKQP